MTGAEYLQHDFTSDDEDPAESWDEYLRVMQGSVSLTFPRQFRSSAYAQRLGHMQMVRFSTAPLDYRRTQRHIRADDEDPSYRILIPIEGRFRFEQGDSREIFYPGKIGFFKFHDPLFMTHEDDVTAMILSVPRDSVSEAHADRAPLALDERRPLVRTLGAQTRLLGEPAGWTAIDWGVAYTAALDVLNGVINPYPAAGLGKGAIDAEKARHLIEQHAKDPRVTPEVIAGMLGIGERTLYKLLKRAGHPPAAAMLRDVRVQRAHRRVRSALPFDMDQVAFDEGFPSARSLRRPTATGTGSLRSRCASGCSRIPRPDPPQAAPGSRRRGDHTPARLRARARGSPSPRGGPGRGPARPRRR